jgi:phosphohistidine phosphatase
MKVYLAQHGHALNKSENPERPLSFVGHAEVGQVADLLAGQLHVSRVVHSGKKRAQQTAEILTAITAGEFPVEEIGGLGPNDSVSAFAKQLVTWDEDILVVGHLPFMEKLVSLLVRGSASKQTVEYAPGSLVCLESDDQGAWRILFMIRPDMLKGG